MVTDLSPRSAFFQPLTHKGPSENSLNFSTAHVWNQVCEVADEVDLSTLSKGSWEMNSLTLQVSMNWHIMSGLSTFQKGLIGNGMELKDSVNKNSLQLGKFSPFSRPSTGRPEAPLVQEGNLRSCPCSHTTQLTEEKKRDSLNS